MDVTIKSLFREPCAVKAAYPVLTGGLGRRTVRQRALILPTWNVTFLLRFRDHMPPGPQGCILSSGYHARHTALRVRTLKGAYSHEPPQAPVALGERSARRTPNPQRPRYERAPPLPGHPTWDALGGRGPFCPSPVGESREALRASQPPEADACPWHIPFWR